jgi:3,4-dihydroxy 2-butanone 4-phosphate synthase/GTP cyclohydrolase II
VSSVRFETETNVPTVYGELRFRAYTDLRTGFEHLAIIADPIGETPIVRVHSECLTGEALGSLKCECGAQLDASLQTVASAGGIVIYMRGHEGRGIGLANKLRAYRLQEDGLDTVDANVALGLPIDDRDYTAAAAILSSLSVARVRLLSNNPAKIAGLTAHGVEVVERLPLVLRQGEFSDRYLATKRDRMGHLIA